ncbi:MULTISPECIES: Slp family lipoprotein [Alteromonadaceae]|jgi:outer membrane lipoprotein|uniref:Slp family lipoprotein n=1 Tax=Brumicola blandensis TaxID=3075611 RepID=A0AAW8QY38_9ALTE|nr:MULTISPECIES: Slp family lipoprotein [unclassified Alteromonas]MDT0581922.1 Slp family lipoprotein [Alteromonas sp. W409]MDT0628400.1 Slp family lipoprotein [Alteromonas sp. W364]
MPSIFKVSIAALALTLGGCAIYPDPIDIGEEVELVSYETIVNGDQAGVGLKARWGGEIVAVVNKKDYSEIEILHYPNNHYGKPRLSSESAGRFKVRVRDFIDPLVFEKGRLVTFIGELGEPAEGLIGEQAYVYPVLIADGYHMWKKTVDYEVTAFSFSPFSPYWAFGPRYGYHRGWGFHHHSGTVRVKVKDGASGTVEASRPVGPSQGDITQDQPARGTQEK